MATNRRLWMLFLLVGLLAAAPLWGQNSINLSGCATQIGAGNTVTCSVNLTLAAGVSLDFLTFSASVTPNGGAPAPTAVGFTSTVAGLSPINGPTSGGGFGSVSINSSISLGSIHYTVPASAAGAQSYTLAFTNAQGSLSGNNVVIAQGAASTTSVIGVLLITAPASLATGTINVAYSPTPVTANWTGSPKPLLATTPSADRPSCDPSRRALFLERAQCASGSRPRHCKAHIYANEVRPAASVSSSEKDWAVLVRASRPAPSGARG